MDPRAKNCLRALAMFCSTAGLAERDLCQSFPKHLASGIIGTVEFMIEVDGRGMLGRFSREQHYLSLGLAEGEAIFGGNICNHFCLGLRYLEWKRQ